MRNFKKKIWYYLKVKIRNQTVKMEIYFTKTWRSHFDTRNNKNKQILNISIKNNIFTIKARVSLIFQVLIKKIKKIISRYVKVLEIISKLSLSRIKILKIIMIKTFLIKIKYLLMVAVKWNCRFITKGLKHLFLLHHHLVMIIYKIMMLLIKGIIINNLKKDKKI